MSYYTFHKGKHGGVAGYIFPFFTPLSGLFPNEDYVEKVPAGFLKCQGQILQANQYRSLAETIGVGNSCIYRKFGVELEEPDSDGEGGQIQLPDLGSKYIAGSLNPGLYSNTETINPQVDRAGISTEISAAGSTVDFFYSGDFKVPSRPLVITGNVTIISPQSATDEQVLSSANFLPHGHTSSFGVGRRVNLNSQGINGATWNQVFLICENSGAVPGCAADMSVGAAFQANQTQEFGTDEGTTHSHIGTLPRISNETKTATIGETTIPAASIQTTVNIRVNNAIKMDEFAPKYILCEYLIKY